MNSNELSDHEKLIVEAGASRALDNGARGAIVDEVMDIEKLFVAWIDDQDASARTLAKRVGMAEGEVRKVLRSGVLQQRYMDEVEGFRAIARPYTEARVHELVDKMIGRMTSILEVGTDKDAIAAVRALSGLLPKDEGAVQQVTHTDTRVLAIVSQGLENIDQVNRLVGTAISGNIQSVEADRSRRG